MTIGNDDDIDFGISHADHSLPAYRASELVVEGLGGADFLSGRGVPGFIGGPASVPVDLFGGKNDDTVVDGASVGDHLSGDENIDTLFSVDGRLDFVNGGSGVDSATVDPRLRRSGRRVAHLRLGRSREARFEDGARARRQDGGTGRELDAPEELARAEDGRADGLRWRRAARRGPRPHQRRADHRLRRSAAGGRGLGPRPPRQDGRARLAVRLPRALAGETLRLAVGPPTGTAIARRCRRPASCTSPGSRCMARLRSSRPEPRHVPSQKGRLPMTLSYAPRAQRRSRPVRRATPERAREIGDAKCTYGTGSFLLPAASWSMRGAPALARDAAHYAAV